MNRYPLLTGFFFGFGLGLSGCTGDGNCSPADCADDSGTPTGTAEVVWDVTVLGVREDCLINAGSVVNASSAWFELPAPADYTVTAGDSALAGQFGFPVHIGQTDGEYWAAPNQSVSLTADEEYEGSFDLFNLFAPGRYSCGYDKYEYDSSAADFKGDFLRHTDLDVQRIQVNQDGMVEPQNDPNMDVMGNYDYLQVENDHLTIVEADADDGLFITESDIGNDFFAATVVFPDWAVYDLRCDLEE
jgi:hypothetical protein